MTTLVVTNPVNHLYWVTEPRIMDYLGNNHIRCLFCGTLVNYAGAAATRRHEKNWCVLTSWQVLMRRLCEQ